MPIESVSVRGVRGIRDTVHFALGGQSLLIHGDNGTGKSSFERALRWALMGEEEPTDHAAHTTAESYRRHSEVDPSFPLVRVVFSDGSSIEVKRSEVLTEGNGEVLRAACKLASPFLRRSELLDVLSSRPVDRFQYLESFLGLEKIDSTISELAAARSPTEGRRSQLATSLLSTLEPFAALLPRSHSRPSAVADLEHSAVLWAAELGFLGERDSIEQLAQKVMAAAESAARGDTSRQRARLEQLLADFAATKALLPAAAASTLEGLNDEKTAIEQQATDPSAATLVEHALDHFRRASGETCPVCGQTVDWGATTTALEQRVKALSKYRSVTKLLRASVTAFHSSLLELERTATRLANEVGHPGSPLSLLLPADPDLLAFSAIPQSDIDRSMQAILAIGPSRFVSLFHKALASGEELTESLLKRIHQASDIASLQTASVFFKRLVDLRPQLHLVESELAALTVEVDLQDKILRALRRSRQDVAGETLTAIQEVVSKYYLAIHPRGTEDDETGAPSIDVQRHGKGSAFVRGEFHGRQVKDPTWAYSDGHLDTVAICIFLALRTFRSQQPNDPKLMVLDDIVISIDLGHARRLITLLKTAFQDHQIIILTHNGLFAHWCKSLIPGLRKLQIKSWSLANGPAIGDYPSAREQIDVALANGTAKEIAVRLMEMLDEWTAEARYAFAVAVPAKVGEQYTLTEIWEPMVKAIKKMGTSLGSDLGGAIGTLETLIDIPAVRNLLGAHENEFAKEYPRNTMVEIGTAACRLVDALYCSECRSFVQPTPSRTSIAMMHCPNHHKQYVKSAPAVNPSKQSRSPA